MILIAGIETLNGLVWCVVALEGWGVIVDSVGTTHAFPGCYVSICSWIIPPLGNETLRLYQEMGLDVPTLNALTPLQ
jgi:hypothetical protein